MKSFIITAKDSGTRVDKFILKRFDKLPKSLMFKEIRKKNIKVNKKRCANDQVLNEGDLLELYLKDDVLIEKEKHYDFLRASDDLDIIYEDSNIILINKKVGVLCHPDGKEYIDNIIARLKKYLYQKGEYDPENDNFTPSLANRIDRNTGGIIIGAKNSNALRIINSAIKNREIKKYYLTVVHGEMPKNEDLLTAYLIKNEKKNMVKIFDNEVDCSKIIKTKYKVLDYKENASLLEVELLTGRTHQIRAHLAHIGHPLFGDGKYGIEQGRYRQALYSYKLQFCFNDSNDLSYLNNKTFEAKEIKMLDDYKKGYFNEKK